MITSDQLKDVLERTDALARYLNIDQKKVEFEEEQLRTQAPDFWEDPKRAQEQMKKVKGIEHWLKDYKAAREYADELQLAFDFYHDDMVTEDEVDADYAKDRGFPGRVVYGLLGARFFSTLAGVYLPGEHCLLHGVECKFAKPIFIGDVLTVKGTVERVSEIGSEAEIKAVITNQDGKRVTRGIIKAGLAK